MLRKPSGCPAFFTYGSIGLASDSPCLLIDLGSIVTYNIVEGIGAPMKKNGAIFDCINCGAQFYRSRSSIQRGVTKTCGKRECKQGPRLYARKGAAFHCVVCGGQFYRSQSAIERGLTKTCGKSECRATYMRRPRPGPRPYRKNGAMLRCVICGSEFYRRKSYLERGIKNTCGKSECKSQFFTGANNPV